MLILWPCVPASGTNFKTINSKGLTDGSDCDEPLCYNISKSEGEAFRDYRYIDDNT
jgi:hypothetical protein